MGAISCFGILFSVLPLLVVAQMYQKPVPTAYHLTLYLEDFHTSDTFKGRIEINVTLPSTSTYIRLDAEDLTVDPLSVSVYRQTMTGTWVKESKFRGVKPLGDQLYVEFSDPAISTNYKISMNYTGSYQTGMRGFAKIPFYFMGETKYLGVTSFEPIFARSVFPCFDDIAFRTNFQLDVFVNMSQIVLSNVMPSYVHNVSDTARVFSFENSAMPVSQLGWAVYDFTTYRVYIANASSTQVHTRAPPLYSKHMAWASDLTATLLDAYSNYTQLRYPLYKLEQVVVPQFSQEAANGWGIVSYPEESILYTPNTSSARDAQRVALEMSRGLAEQWFEGILSVKSWQSQWFAEGMTDYLKYTVMAKLLDMSSWELEDHMVVDMVQPALAMDNTNYSLEMSSMNDTLLTDNTYSSLAQFKGGALIRMLQNILGDELFDSSLATYLKKRYSETRQIDSASYYDYVYMYLSDLEMDVSLAKQSVAVIMDGWTSIPGHPVVNVTWNGTHYNISQSSDSKLYVPVIFMLQDSQVANKTWLTPGPGASFVFASPSGPKWILVNVNQTGFYRVRYDATLLSLLTKQLSSDPSKIPRLSRAQILDDVFSDLSSGLVTPGTLLNVTSYLSAETDYFPWVTALRNFQNLLNSLYNRSSYALLQNHLRDNLLKKIVDQVGFSSKPTDTHTEKLRRALILENACALELPVCKQKAVSALMSWMAGTYYDADVIMALLCSGVSNSNSSTWYELLTAHGDSKYPTVRANILKALTCTRDPSVLYPYLTNITSSSFNSLNSKDKNIFLKTLASTPSGAELLLDWLLRTLTIQSKKEDATSSSPTTIPVSSNITSPSTVNVTTETTTTQTIDLNESDTNSSESGSSERNKRDINMNETLSEEDINTILNYITSKLTTLQQGIKIEKFLQQSDLQLSNDTLLVMKKAAAQVYKNDQSAQKYNGGMTVWLSAKAAAALTTVPPSTTHPGDSGGSKPGSASTPKPATPNNEVTNTYSTLIVTLSLFLVLVSYKFAL